MARPSNTLKWADTLAAHPTTGQNNRVQYPAAYETDGWGYQERPARNHDNWFKWLAGEWAQYLDGAIARAATLYVAASNASAESKNHADYVCDGTDDHTEINAAIAALPAAGGTVLLSEGTFTIDATIALDTQAHIRGCGIGATTIEVDTSSIGAFAMMSATSKSRFSIRDLTLDGNAASLTAIFSGILLTTCSHVHLNHVEIKELSTTSGYGIDVDGSTQVLIAQCEIDNNEGVGIQIDNSAHSVHLVNCYFSTNNLEVDLDADDCSIVGCTFREGTGGGITILGSDNVISQCLIRGMANDGITVSGNDNLIDGCVIKDNDYHGIELTGSVTGNLIRGCWIKNNSQDTHDTSSGILFSNTTGGNIVTNCFIYKGASSPQQKYGIDTGTSTTNRIFNNDLTTSGNTGSTNGSGYTIPQWIGSGAAANSQNDITKANLV